MFHVGTFYVNGKDVQNNDQKKALLLHTAGMDVRDIFETLDELPFVAAFEGDTDNVFRQAVRNCYRQLFRTKSECDL